VFPVNMLAREPSARLEQIESLMQTGLIQPEQGKALLDFPDLESTLRVDTAPVEELEMIVEQIVEHGRYIAPEPFMNLSAGIRLMQFARSRARVDGVSDEKLDLMAQWCEEAQAILSAGQPPPAPVPGPMPPGAGGQGMMPPNV